MANVPNSQLQEYLWLLFQKPPAPTLALGNTALVCIDLQYHDGHPNYGLGAKATALGISDFLTDYWTRVETIVLPNVRRLQDAARLIGLEVIHVRVASATRDGRDNSIRYKRMGTGQSAALHDTQILPGYGEKDDELVFNKTTSSAFNSTTIDRVLRNMGIRNLVVVGLVTNGCVEATVRSAAEFDYDVVVVEDATAAMAPQLHEHSILSMSYKDAAILTTDQVLSLLPDAGTRS